MPITGPDRGCLEAEFRRPAEPLETVLVVAVALVDPDGRVLIAKRPEGKPMAGLWEFPGGKVRDGELPEEALVRELDEELGIDITESCLAPLSFASHVYDDFHLLMTLYVCRVWKGMVSPAKARKSNGCARCASATIRCRRPISRWWRC